MKRLGTRLAYITNSLLKPNEPSAKKGPAMANQTSRGGKKEIVPGQKPKHAGVRPGSTGTRKERGQQEPRQPVVPKKSRTNR